MTRALVLVLVLALGSAGRADAYEPRQEIDASAQRERTLGEANPLTGEPARMGDPVPRARTERIEITAEPGLESVAAELRDVAALELGKIQEDLVDVPTPATIRIQVVRDASSLASVAPAGRGAPPWAIGVAYPDLAILSVAMRRGSAVVDVRSTLRHELAHLALGAAIGEHAPHWLHEGFAYQHSAEWSWDRTETLAGMAWFGGIVPIEQLDQSFPAEEAPANRAYAESYDFVGYLARRGAHEDTADDGDRWPFRRFLTSLSHGASLDEAAMHAYHRPLRALFDEWRDSLAKRYLFAPIGLLGLALWIFCALLLTLAYLRRRRYNRRRIAQWDREERDADARARRDVVVAPPYVPWPGEDPLSDDDEPSPDEPKLMN